jgi:hypothetical protein
LVQNALKLTYEHLQVQKIFLGSLSLAVKGGKGEGRGGEGREGEGKEGEGKGREGRGGKGGEGKGRREGQGTAPLNQIPGSAPGVILISLLIFQFTYAKLNHVVSLCDKCHVDVATVNLSELRKSGNCLPPL